MNQPTRSFYERLLRLNHLRLRGPVAFALFEGSIGVAVLLALAEFVSWWGVLAIPASVAFMVKLNDIVAGAAMRPLAFAASPRFAGVVVGRSPVPRPSRLTAAIGDDDAVPDPAARPDSPPTARGRAVGVARGVAMVPTAAAGGRRPTPVARTPEPPLRNAGVPSAEFGDPAKVDSAKGDPAKVDSAKGNPSKGDPTKGDRLKGDPAKGDSAPKPDPSTRRNQRRFTT